MACPIAAYPDCESLRLTRRGARLELTLDRAATKNALTHAMMQEIGAVVSAVGGDSELRALVLRGAGGNFCAGGDLNFMADMPPPPAAGEADPLVAPYRYFGDVLVELNNLPQAVVAVVAGAAVGGGFGMACCSDVVIALPSARFGMPEPRVGFIPSQVIPFVTRRIGVAQARRLAVTGETVDSAAAVALGIAHYAVADEAEAEAVLARVLEQIGRCEPAAVAAVKRLVLASEGGALESVLDDAAASLVDLLRRPSARQGIDAFMAKRPPPWRDKLGD